MAERKKGERQESVSQSQKSRGLVIRNLDHVSLLELERRALITFLSAEEESVANITYPPGFFIFIHCDCPRSPPRYCRDENPKIGPRPLSRFSGDYLSGDSLRCINFDAPVKNMRKCV